MTDYLQAVFLVFTGLALGKPNDAALALGLPLPCRLCRLRWRLCTGSNEPLP